MKIDFGCGPNKIAPDWRGVDSRPFPGVDTVMNIAERVPLSSLASTTDEKLDLLVRIQEGFTVPFKPWPWADSSVDEAHASHFVEHLKQDERVHFCNELWRVLKPGGKARIICPDFSSGRAYGDMTHQWPPACGMWLYYLSAEWRKNNAPHNDGYVCDFVAIGNYNLRPDLMSRNAEYQMYAVNNYKEACHDLIADLTCVKP